VFTFPSPDLPLSLKSYLLTDNFNVIRNVRQIPEPVLGSFTEKGTARLLMVNPGEDYNSTDVVNGRLPRRRLVIAAASEHLFFVHYEEGGFVTQTFLEVFENRSGELIPRWYGRCDKPTKDLPELRSEISLGHCQ
jgi:hypothetical protein